MKEFLSNLLAIVISFVSSMVDDPMSLSADGSKFPSPERFRSPLKTRGSRGRRPKERRQPRGRSTSGNDRPAHRRGRRRGGTRGMGGRRSPAVHRQLPNPVSGNLANDAPRTTFSSETAMEQLQMSIDEFNRNISRVFVPQNPEDLSTEVRTYKPATNQITIFPSNTVRGISLLSITLLPDNTAPNALASGRSCDDHNGDI